MRPFSKYLEKVKSENHNVDFNLGGSTPPLNHAQKILQVDSISMDLTESRGSRSLFEMKRKISSMSKFADENIEFFPGTSQAIFQLFAALTKQGDSVVIETPTYTPIVDIAKFLGLKIQRFKRTIDFEEDVRNLRKILKTSKLAFLTNPHCPTGRFLSETQIQQLDQLNKPVILDEIYLPYFAPGKMTFVRPNSKNLISVSGFSKTLGISSVRLSWALGPSKYLKPAALIGYNLTVDLPTPSFVLGNMALEKWDEIIKSVQTAVETNRKTLRQYENIIGPHLSHDLHLGHFATIQKPKGMSSEGAFLNALKKQSVFLRPGSDFEMKNHFRFHLMADPTDFSIAIKRITSIYEV